MQLREFFFLFVFSSNDLLDVPYAEFNIDYFVTLDPFYVTYYYVQEVESNEDLHCPQTPA